MTETVIGSDIGLTLSELRDALRSYFADGGARAEVRAIAEGRASGFDRDRWRAISSTLGVGALLADESHGGLGLDLHYACAAVEVAGEMLCPSPVRSTLLATQVLADTVAAGPSPTEHPASRWLEQIAAQSASATVAVDPDPRVGGQVLLADDADRTAGAPCSVSGTIAMVTDASDADHLVLWASGTGAVDVGAGALVGVDLTDARVIRTRLAGTDLVGGMASIELDRCPAVILGGHSVYERAVRQALVLRAAEQVGLARGCLAMATDHARSREQFGRIIGSYQAISHRLAQTAVDIEGAAGLVTMACDAVVEATARADALAPLAAASAARVSSAAADTVIQVLGGIGFTWEHDAQFYFRRIATLAVWMGSANVLDDVAASAHCHRLLRA